MSEEKEMKSGIFSLAGVLAVAVMPIVGLGWGHGHDTVARGVLARLEEGDRAKFRKEWMKEYIKAAHMPDGAPLKLLSDPDRERLARAGIEKTYPLHGVKGRLALFDCVADALRRGDGRGAFVAMAALSHSVADPVACNHDPLVHCATYLWGKEGLGVCGGLELDFGFAERNAAARAALEKRVAELEIETPPAGVTREEAFGKICLWEAESPGVSFATGAGILEAAAEWGREKSAGAEEKLAKRLGDLGLWAVARTVWLWNAAKAVAARGGELGDADYGAVAARWGKEYGHMLRGRLAKDDSFAAQFARKAGEKSAVRILYDATGHMSSGVFSTGSRIFACQLAGSLRRMRPELNATLLDARPFAEEGLDPAEAPVMVVFGHRVSGHLGFDAKGFNAQVKKYVERGGKLIWISGTTPRGVMDGVMKAKKSTAKGDGYCNPAYPVGLDELMGSRLALKKAGGGEKEWGWKRRPNGKAGWMWDGSRNWWDAGALPRGAEGVVELRTGGGAKYTMGVVEGRVAYLPTCAIFPYVLTEEKPEISAAGLRLDSAGEEIVGEILKRLEK